MEATKVQILPETLRLNSLDEKGRKNLRKQLVKDFIEKQPAGTRLRKQALIKAAGYSLKNHTEYAAGWSFIGGMLNRGEILAWKQPHSHSALYSLPGTVVKPATEPKPEQEAAEKPQIHIDTSQLQGSSQVESTWVTQRAKEFAWTYNSDSLRDFVRFLETGK